jgi:hypothetical protein
MTRLLLLLPLTACATGAMTTPEGLEGLDQAVRSDAGIQVTARSVEVSTTFTLGAAVEAAAEELAAFWDSQAPCTEVALNGATLAIDYGTLDDDCTYEGRTYAGLSEVTVVGAADGAVEVAHGWTGLTDGFFQVDGGALVTWDGHALTRSVDTTHTWTELATGETVDVTGRHVMGSLDGGGFFDGGITLDGDRQWVDDAGDAWDLVISGVEARWIDPAPQAGTLAVTNPDGKTLDIAFSRVDETTVRAEVTGTRRPITVDITALGQVTVVEE